jgi:hypothetical protein
MHVCVCVRMYVCMHVCMLALWSDSAWSGAAAKDVYGRLSHIHTYARTHTHTHTHIQTDHGIGQCMGRSTCRGTYTGGSHLQHTYAHTKPHTHTFRPIMASDSAWGGAPAEDVYGRLSFTAYSEDLGAQKGASYQLLLCGSGWGTGLFMAGITRTELCPDGWKTCYSWCKDTSSDYYRHAYSPKSSRMYNAPYNFTGVAFRENGHRSMGKRLMSVGIRASGNVCQAGWQGNGVICQCRALMYSGELFVYWRFEDGYGDVKVGCVYMCVYACMYVCMHV